MGTDDPLTQLKLYHNIKNSNEQIWLNNRNNIMKKGVTAKFSQNPELRNKLINTCEKILFECNPHDAYWGVQMDLNNKKILNTLNWRGENALGKLLMLVRTELH